MRCIKARRYIQRRLSLSFPASHQRSESQTSFGAGNPFPLPNTQVLFCIAASCVASCPGNARCGESRVQPTPGVGYPRPRSKDVHAVIRGALSRINYNDLLTQKTCRVCAGGRPSCISGCVHCIVSTAKIILVNSLVTKERAACRVHTHR